MESQQLVVVRLKVKEQLQYNRDNQEKVLILCGFREFWSHFER